MFKVVDEVLAFDLEVGDVIDNEGPVTILSTADDFTDQEIIVYNVRNEYDDEYEVTMSYDFPCEILMDIADYSDVEDV